MMLAYKLVRLIETHSDALAAGLLAKVQNSELTRSYRNVPPEDLKDRVFDIYTIWANGFSARVGSILSSGTRRSARGASTSAYPSAS